MHTKFSPENFRMWTGFMWFMIIASVVGFCEHDNETSGFIKGEEFIDQLSEC
jgi:hypothetical protein